MGVVPGAVCQNKPRTGCSSPVWMVSDSAVQAGPNPARLGVGPAGPPGPAGKDGTNGRDGADGASGQTCPTGYSLQPPPGDPDALVCRRDIPTAPDPATNTAILGLPVDRRRT
ncbi:hypothetical protein [Streptomyces sp. NPDC050392]|uniref:hypothetical protein n=1 Tax=Streptomyces sp. NPDC050392 TaxID=3155782 RepID=UPI00341B933E